MLICANVNIAQLALGMRYAMYWLMQSKHEWLAIELMYAARRMRSGTDDIETTLGCLSYLLTRYAQWGIQ